MVIYQKESQVSYKVDYWQVFGWQLVIWISWLVIYYLINTYWEKIGETKYPKVTAIASIFFCLVAHFGWYYNISANYSPYLGLPHTKYGVYPYFFIFWSVVDFAILAVILQSRAKNEVDEKASSLLTFEVRRGNETFYCSPEEILWLSSENYYTKLQTIKGEFLVRKSLKYYQENLPFGVFLKIHRSTIVNVNHVVKIRKAVNRSHHEVVLSDGAVRRISLTYLRSTREFFRLKSH